MKQQHNHIREKIKKICEEIDALEKQAGIYEQAKEARDSLYGQEDKIRRLYFAIPDQELRRKIMEKEWECNGYEFDLALSQVRAMETKIAKIRSEGNWYLKAIAASIIAVAIGNQSYGVAGAIGGAMTGFFFGMGIKEEETRNKKERIRDANEELIELRKMSDQAFERTFKVSELSSGTPTEEKE
jgi:hypothetical protein